MDPSRYRYTSHTHIRARTHTHTYTRARAHAHMHRPPNVKRRGKGVFRISHRSLAEMASPAATIFCLPWICTHRAEVRYVESSDIAESATVQHSHPPPFESLHLESCSTDTPHTTAGIASESVALIGRQ